MSCSMRVEILGICSCGRVYFEDEGRKSWTSLESIRRKATGDTPEMKCDFCKGTFIDFLDPKSRYVPAFLSQ